MSHSSGRRAQVEPFAAIVAVFAVGVGLTVYAGALDASVPATPNRDVARPTIDRVSDRLGHGGVLDPQRLENATEVAPTGYRLNATLTAAGQRWQVGPAPPAAADTTSERVSVQLAPGQVRPGLLEVRVWQ
jgi:hypothetical protein